MTPVQVLWAVIVLYLVLGTFMEELSMMISTIPITTPLMVQAGYDPVWYGILLVLLIQTAMISPPFGINLFVIHGIRGRGTLSDVEKGSAPFVIALLAMIAMICVWPDLSRFRSKSWKQIRKPDSRAARWSWPIRIMARRAK